MKPVLIIEFVDGKRQIFISHIGLIIIGATTFVAIHIFFHAAISSYVYITKQIAKKKRPAADLKLPRGGSDSSSEIVDSFVDTLAPTLTKCIKKPGVYLILNERLKTYLRKQLQIFSTKVLVIIDPLAFLVANYMSNRINAYLRDLARIGFGATMQNLINPIAIFASLMVGVFIGNFALTHVAVLATGSVNFKKFQWLTSLLVTIVLSSPLKGLMINCDDYVKHYPIAAPNEQVVIDVKHTVLLPEKQPNMMFVQTTNNLELIFPEYSKKICEVEIPKNAGLETVEPRGPKKGEGYYFKERCSRSKDFKAFSGKIHTLADFQEINMQDKKQAEKDLKTYSYEPKKVKERTNKIRTSNEE